MEFTQRDMGILLSMTLAIIMLNFAFSGVGLAEDSVNSTQIPEYDLPQDRFALAGQFPDYPGNPSKGEISINVNSSNNNNNYRYLYETTNEVYGIDVIKPVGSEGVSVGIFYENGTFYEEKRNDLVNESDVKTINYESYKVRFELNNIQNSLDGTEYQVKYHIQESPSENDDSFAERIPVVGGILSAGQGLAQVLSWIGSIFSWIVQTIYKLVIAMVLTIYEAIAFIVSLVSWILTSYGNIVTNAQGFASVFIAIPGLLLGMELLKVGFIIVHLLPTT